MNNKTDRISEKYIFYRRKKSKTRVDIYRSDPLFHETDPDPYQNETDPQHCQISLHASYNPSFVLLIENIENFNDNEEL